MYPRSRKRAEVTSPSAGPASLLHHRNPGHLEAAPNPTTVGWASRPPIEPSKPASLVCGTGPACEQWAPGTIQPERHGTTSNLVWTLTVEYGYSPTTASRAYPSSRVVGSRGRLIMPMMTFPGWANVLKNWHGKQQALLHSRTGGATGALVNGRWYYSPIRFGGK